MLSFFEIESVVGYKMGLVWSDTRSVRGKDDKLYLVKSAPIIGTDIVNEDELWHIYKIYKKNLEKDGFSVSASFKKTRVRRIDPADIPTSAWQISYWHSPTIASYENVAGRGHPAGRDRWIAEFDEKCDKWEKIILTLRQQYS